MYPFETLTVITPIVFFVLLLVFPIIGLFAGWKRATYWGGGNFLFYIIGLIIWKTAGMNICMGFTNMLYAIGGEKIMSLDFNTLLNSIISPLFFLIVILGGNLILLICYYAFAKRLLKIGRYAKLNKKTKVVAQTKHGKTTHVANTKWFNRTVGAVGLTALMLPITLTTTHLTTMVTTSTNTRKTNAFTKGMYDGLQTLSNRMSWFSYYNGDRAGRDYDGLFSAISLFATTINYKNTSGENKVDNVIKAITETFNTGYNNLINKTLDPNINFETKEKATPIVDALNNLIDSFNSIMDSCEGDLEVLFDSPGVVSLLNTLLCTASGSIKINDEQLLERFFLVDSVFNTLLQGYLNNIIITADLQVLYIHEVDVAIGIQQDTFDLLVDAIYNLYDVSSISQENQTHLKEYTAKQLQLMFYIK